MPPATHAYGCLTKTPDRRDWLSQPPAAYSGEFVSLRASMPPVWDQGQLGSCVAFGTTAALAYARMKAGLPALDPSQLFTYWAARSRAGYPTDQDTGLEIRDGIQSLAKDGTPPSADWPYDISQFTVKPPQQAWSDAAADEATVYGSVAANAIDDMIASGFPVVIGFDVYESFESDETASTGVMPVPGSGEQLLGGHCVVLTSTPKDGSEIQGGVAGVLYREARNSWSADWGLGGYFWFPLPAMMNRASDFWQITTVSAPGPQPVPPPPNPTPGPDDADEALWTVGKRWTGRWLSEIPGNRDMDRALVEWAHRKGF